MGAKLWKLWYTPYYEFISSTERSRAWGLRFRVYRVSGNSRRGPRAKYVLILMGSGAGVVEEYLAKMGDKARV